jgi:hypothetical protein
MEGDVYMADATTVLMAFMKAKGIRPEFRYGQLALALEVVSLIRTLEFLPVVNDAEREGTVATLHTLLREQGLENAYEAYDQLAEWRKVKFVASDASPRGSAGAVAQHGRGLVVSASAVSSAHDALGQERAQRDRLRERPWERPNLDEGAVATNGQLELPYEEG